MTIPTQAEDLVLVPREPTREMLDRAQQDAAHHDTARRGYGFRDTWLSMISAVPSIGGGEGDSSSCTDRSSPQMANPALCAPTEEMIIAGRDALYRRRYERLKAIFSGEANKDMAADMGQIAEDARACFNAMIEAAPSSEAPPLSLKEDEGLSVAESGGSRPQEAVKSDGPRGLGGG